MRARDTSADAAAVQIEVYRRIGPEARLRAGLALTETSRRLLFEGIRRRHPDYDPAQVRLAGIRAWLGPDLYRRAYPDRPELDP
jgi:hypothetical protein